jgi:hypothetical protein
MGRGSRGKVKLAGVIVDESDETVDAAIGPLFLLVFNRFGAHERKRPLLDLAAVRLGQHLRATRVGRFAAKGKLNAGKRLSQGAFHQGDSEMGGVDANPGPPELLHSDDGGPAFFLEKDVVVALGIERRIEIDQIDRLGRHVVTENVENISVEERVFRGHAQLVLIRPSD